MTSSYLSYNKLRDIYSVPII